MTPFECGRIEEIANRYGKMQDRYMNGIDRYAKEGNQEKVAYCDRRLAFYSALIDGMKAVLEALGYRLYYVIEDHAYHIYHGDPEKEAFVK